MQQGDEGRSLQNYLDMVEFRMCNGQAVTGLHPGELDQIRMHHPTVYPGFHIRNIASNGIIWTGRGSEIHQYIPPDAVKDCHYDENPLITPAETFPEYQITHNHSGGTLKPQYLQWLASLMS